MKVVLLDTGPLVAALNARDEFHGWAHEQLKRVAAPLLTCEAVLAEALYLLRGIQGGHEAVFGLLSQKLVTVPFRLDEEQAAVGRLMKRYASVPMSLADACLVRMSEQHESAAILTVDSDFKIYRRHGRNVIPTLAPP